MLGAGARGCSGSAGGLTTAERATRPQVVTKNPGILACNPAGLKESNAPTIKGMASVVNVVEGSIGWMKLGRFINTGIK